jgi:hypothetical protein
MKNLYALLVGINEYSPPNTPLYGCVKDVNRVEQYIREYHADQFDLQIKKLLNKEASYSNIINGFRQHLSQATEDDMVWFHFSGHGSEEKSAPEFSALEPNGKDQTLWCADSGVDDVFNLADKELAVLLHEIATTYPDGSPKKSPPHILVSLDCCHSGSGTRDAGDSDQMRTRNARASGRDRPIDSYVSGYYAKQGSHMHVPAAPHVVLSACQTFQLAGDLNDGGAFTNGLIRALKASKGQINYADLFIRTRASVRQIRENQTPDFSSIENFNPYQQFLASEELGVPQHYEVFFENAKWYIRCGAIHGLPTDSDTPIKVELRSFPKNNVLGHATITSVGAQQSALNTDFKFSIKSTVKDIAPGEDHYRGVIMSFPAAPVYVYVHGDDNHVRGIELNWPEDTHIQFVDEDREDASIDLKIQNNVFALTDRKTDTIVQEVDLNDQSDVELNKVYDSLFVSYSKINKWYSFRDLKNKNKASKITDWVSLHMHVLDAKGGQTVYTDSHVTLYANKENSRQGQFGFLPKVLIKNTTQDLFMYLMYMQPNFAIDCPEDEIIFYAAEYDSINELEMQLWKNIRGFGPAPKIEDDGVTTFEPSVTSHFKLLVTTEKLDYFQFLQSKLGNHRSNLSLWQPDKVSDDWTSINMAVTICLQNKSIEENKPTRINNNVQVSGSDVVQADVVLSPLAKSNDKVSGDNPFLLQRDDFRLLDLRDNHKTAAPHVLEFQNLRAGHAETLEQNPLHLQLNQSCEQNEMIIPMAFDGKYFRVTGDGHTTDGETQVDIHRLPSLRDAGKNMDEYQGNRGVMSTLKMAFFKLVMNNDQTNKISALEVKDDELVLTTSGMAERVMTSTNFLLILHGIMGDGLSICKDLGMNNADFYKKYDCVLVYDYECLNTPLDETARLLRDEIEKFNIHQHKDKSIDIVAHSCGGLIARWLIEQEGGHAYVNNLTLLATPNSGSLFGKVEEYRSFALNILEVAANFMPQIIPGSGLLIKVLKFAGNLTPALGQMSPDSNFLTQLNTSADPGIPYNIVVGDARNVDRNHASDLIKRLYSDSTRNASDTDVHDLFITTKSAELRPIFERRKNPPVYHTAIPAHHFTLIREFKFE